MRAGIANCQELSFEGLCVELTRRDLTGRRYRHPGGSPLPRHAGPQVGVAAPCDIAVGASSDHRRRLLALRRAGTALPMALDGDDGKHDRQRGLPVDWNTLVAWTGHRLVCRTRDVTYQLGSLVTVRLRSCYFMR